MDYYAKVLILACVLLLLSAFAIALAGNGIRRDRRQGGRLIDYRNRNGIVRYFPEGTDPDRSYVDANAHWFANGGQ